MSRNLKLLRENFPVLIWLPVIVAGEVIGQAKQTVRNHILAGTFPVPTHKMGGRRFVHIADLAGLLDARDAEAAAGVIPTRHGLITKSEKIGLARDTK